MFHGMLFAFLLIELCKTNKTIKSKDAIKHYALLLGNLQGICRVLA